jgi:hypothetical protein
MKFDIQQKYKKMFTVPHFSADTHIRALLSAKKHLFLQKLKVEEEKR